MKYLNSDTQNTSDMPDMDYHQQTPSCYIAGHHTSKTRYSLGTDRKCNTCRKTKRSFVLLFLLVSRGYHPPKDTAASGKRSHVFISTWVTSTDTPGGPEIHLRINMRLELKLLWNLVTAHLLLTAAEQKHLLEHERIITCLTTIIPSTNVNKRQRIDKTHGNVTAAKPIVCVLARAQVTYIFLTQILEKSYAFI